MIRIKCDACGKKVPSDKAHFVEHIEKTLCDDCYTDDIRKNEDLYDFCSASEYEFIDTIEEQDDPLDREVFFHK
ncbi:hypothetical protein [[Clostridium] innocuum]|uniref:hypothetical protein n=1 Tax=Clostridium innocuum TaxID=1522 RepID=UPI0015E8607E|nr:hypothetical protein [[Clostridium] innocuum]MCR0315613.1 hypothetical protein [[Clostridium] innocuum]MCR0604247.1 hypothetical protein [[Clostridium] innocuum]